MELEDQDGHPAVIAYRMGQVESEVKLLGTKMDTIITLYPTESRVLQLIKPIEDDIAEIKKYRDHEHQAKLALQGQFKIAVFAAIASPLATLVIALVVRI